MMNDHEILGRIHTLVAEENDLRERHQADGLARADKERLDALEVALDQCWDLLRQRRARREFGQDPNAAHLRDPQTVEKYQQ
jgi:hypothetical protein